VKSKTSKRVNKRDEAVAQAFPHKPPPFHALEFRHASGRWECVRCGYVLGTAAKKLEPMPPCPKDEPKVVYRPPVTVAAGGLK
jgi:hypothetical protein